MILSELMDKLGIPSQAKDIMADAELKKEIVVRREDGRRYFLTGEIGSAIAGNDYREIIIWVEA